MGEKLKLGVGEKLGEAERLGVKEGLPVEVNEGEQVMEVTLAGARTELELEATLFCYCWHPRKLSLENFLDGLFLALPSTDWPSAKSWRNFPTVTGWTMWNWKLPGGGFLAFSGI